MSFADAATVFADPFALHREDNARAGRVVVIGHSTPRVRLLCVVTVDRGEKGERIRIISARKAEGSEYEEYEKGEP